MLSSIRRSLPALLVLLTGLCQPLAWAAELTPEARAALNRYLPASGPDVVRKGPLEGIFTVGYGAQIYYVSADGRYLFQGAFIEADTGENITENFKGELVKEELQDIGEERMVVFPAEDPEHTVTVFTDIDCGYCRKLHNEIDAINERGITVRYLFFPRSGPDTESYYKARSVWCAEDRQQALTAAKNGKSIPRKSCENPIDEHLQLVRQLGLRGTPAIVLEDGRILPGYVPADKLLAVLEGAPLR